MTESQHPEDSTPTSGQAMKNNPSGFLISLVIAAIVILLTLIYNALFPEAYWQSRELEQNQAKWVSQHITHYRMSIDLPYSDPAYRRMPLTVEVKNDKVLWVVDAMGQSISPVDDKDFRYYYPYAFTIPGLFSYAHQTFWEKPPEIVVSYDRSLGYPDSISITPYVEPCCQEETYAVRDFKVLPP